MLARKRKIIRVIGEAGRAGGIDKRNRIGRATWNCESEGTSSLLLPPPPPPP